MHGGYDGPLIFDEDVEIVFEKKNIIFFMILMK